MATSIRFGSKWRFIIAVSASAVGLGNVWRFPYLAGENGGGAFVLMYIAFVLVLGLPLLMTEMGLGRLTRGNPVAAFSQLHQRFGWSKHWRFLGGAFILAAFLILTYYVVVSGWVLHYFIQAFPNHFAHITDAQSQQLYQHFMHNPQAMLLMGSIVSVLLWLTMVVEINAGLERVVTVLFPLMLMMFILLLVYAIKQGDMHHALVYLFRPDWSSVHWRSVIEALGQAFFSLGIGMGVLMMYSAYLPEKISIATCAVTVVVIDTAVALLSGLIVFPLVFAYHLAPSSGPGLIFETLPLAFNDMPLGGWVAMLFFLALLFAAFTSLVSLMEPAIAWLQTSARMTRRRSAALVTLLFWLCSILAVYAFAEPERMRFLGLNYYQIADYVSANVIMPVGGLLLAVMVAWRLPREQLWQQWRELDKPVLRKVMVFIVGFIIPGLIVLILLGNYF